MSHLLSPCAQPVQPATLDPACTDCVEFEKLLDQPYDETCATVAISVSARV